MNNFYAITCYFSPVGSKSLLENYFVFAEQLARQGVPLITVELAFNDNEFQIPETEGVYRLRSNSICFQKERLLNYGISKLPPECKYFAWIDCDVLFEDDNWAKLAVEKLEAEADIIQLFKKVYFLPKDVKYISERYTWLIQGVIWDYKIHKNWLKRRLNKDLPFSHPGFAWAAKKEFFEGIGLYDKNILGSGDTFLVDCFLNSFELHNYKQKFNSALKEDMEEYRVKIRAKKPKLDYLAINIYHLWHGSMKNRNYNDRHKMLWDYNFQPKEDIKLVNDVWEWSSDKTGFHNDIKQYFINRKEDENV